VTTTPDFSSDRDRDADDRATSHRAAVQVARTAPAAVATAGNEEGVLHLGVRCGLFAAAATAGVLAGFAIRAGDGAAAPFAAAGRMLLGVPASAGAAAQSLAVVAGVLLHCAIVVAWALPFAALVRRRRSAAVLVVTAALYAAAAYLTSERLFPELLRLGHGARAFPPQLVLLYVVLAVALGLGMRLAFSGNASPSAASH
jgi:hypothetical protein